MKVTHYVNAMVALEGKSSKVLCDPWVTFQKKAKQIYIIFQRLQ